MVGGRVGVRGRREGAAASMISEPERVDGGAPDDGRAAEVLRDEEGAGVGDAAYARAEIDSAGDGEGIPAGGGEGEA